jgi:hypothetical protein
MVHSRTSANKPPVGIKVMNRRFASPSKSASGANPDSPNPTDAEPEKGVSFTHSSTQAAS